MSLEDFEPDSQPVLAGGDNVSQHLRRVDGWVDQMASVLKRIEQGYAYHGSERFEMSRDDMRNAARTALVQHGYLIPEEATDAR